VPLFFAISGFLITTLLLRERDRTGTVSLSAFYARRSLRIFPLYYRVLALYVVLVFLFEHDGGARGAFFHNLRFFATYTSNWFVVLDWVDGLPSRAIFYFAWSLATEEQFYLAWPSVEKVSRGRLAGAPVLVALLTVAVWALVEGDVVLLDHASLGRRVLRSIAPAICFGVTLAHVLHSERLFGPVARVLGQRWLSPLLLVVVVASLYAEGLGWRLFAYLAMTLLVGACVVDEEHSLAPLLRARPVASVGQVSYGIYLLHMLVVNAVEKALGRAGVRAPAAVFPAELLAVWGVAWLSFRYYESRFLALKGRFAR
jgi:peptidoglycan/LPS O-acetylase OafA/YrhL